MSAVPTFFSEDSDKAAWQLAPMHEEDLHAVLSIEEANYPYPWTHGNFVDSLRSGYQAHVLRKGDGTLIGYFLMMFAVDEAHLLNITVSAPMQGRGVGRLLLDKAGEVARQHGMQSMLLEVRPSNERALRIYLRYGFTQIGLRKQYYPAPDNGREDAIVMRQIL